MLTGSCSWLPSQKMFWIQSCTLWLFICEAEPFQPSVSSFLLMTPVWVSCHLTLSIWEINRTVTAGLCPLPVKKARNKLPSRHGKPGAWKGGTWEPDVCSLTSGYPSKTQAHDTEHSVHLESIKKLYQHFCPWIVQHMGRVCLIAHAHSFVVRNSPHPISMATYWWSVGAHISRQSRDAWTIKVKYRTME